MLVSNWAQNYWALSTVAKKTLYDYKNVFRRVVEPFIGSKDLDEVSLMDIQKLVLATTPYQGLRLFQLDRMTLTGSLSCLVIPKSHIPLQGAGARRSGPRIQQARVSTQNRHSTIFHESLSIWDTLRARPSGTSTSTSQGNPRNSLL